MLSRILAASLFVTLTLTSCAGSSPSGEDESYEGAVVADPAVDQQAVSGEQYGPQVPTPEQDAAANAALPPAAPPPGGPLPSVPPPAPGASPAPAAPAPSPSAPKLCLVLGPGMAKALAEASVLEAIRKANIPVHCVVGTEVGALVGALYSQANGSTNALQWQLFKLNNDTYFNFPMLSLREPKASGRRLHEYLRDIFNNRKIEDLPIRFGTVATDLDRDSTVAFANGDLADALSATLAMPGIFEPWRVEGESLYSGAVSSPAPLELARKLGGNFLVLIDVVEDAGGKNGSGARFQKAFSPVRNLIRLQKREASFVISVPAGNIAYEDFGKQGEILADGARAATASVAELKAAWEKWAATPH